MFKWMIYLTLIATSLVGEPLLFKAGDRALYKISQKRHIKDKILYVELVDVTTEVEMTAEVEILSTSESFAFPIEVAFTIKDLHVRVIDNDEDEEVDALDRDHKKAIGQKLLFHLDSPYEISELTGYFETRDALEVSGFRLFLFELFALSGKEIDEKEAIDLKPIPYVDLIPPLKEGGRLLCEEAFFYPNSSEEGSWRVKAHLQQDHFPDKCNIEIKGSGNVVWNRQNPLLQERNGKITVISTVFGKKTKSTLEERWETEEVAGEEIEPELF